MRTEFFPLDGGKSNAVTIPKNGLGVLVPYWNNVFQNWMVVSCFILFQWVDFWERIWVAANLLVAGNMSQKEIVGLV